jgi:hypothetical protein
LGQHPLIELANDREVRQAKGFRAAAAELSGESISVHYKQELASAPSRHEAGRKYLGNHPGRPPRERKNGKDEEHLASALLRHCQEKGALTLPRQGGSLRLIDYQVPLQSAAPDREKGDADPNKGVGKADLLGMGPDSALAIVKLKFLPPDATRGGTGDTPLRALLEGLACAAIAEANRSAIQSEVSEAGGAPFSDDPPMLILLASPRYWQLCRKREAQKGAAWIKEMERLAREVGEELGVQILYLGLDLDGDPGWEYAEEGPVIRGEPSLDPAWERNAGRLRPKAAPRPKGAQAQAEAIVEPDLSRPIRGYNLTESYQAGDRIQHPTLGTGVVQGGAGHGKILVRFDEKKSLLVHERPARGT